MITDGCQRWRDHRSSYRPAREVIDVARYEVAPIADDTTAKAFVCQNHYSGSFPAARRRFALYDNHALGALVGVAVFSQPIRDTVLACLPGETQASIELGRLVLLDEVPANAESWFLARAFEHLRREGFVGVVSFSDPVARTTAAGEVVFPGHLGTCYQALNATYLGRASARTLRLLPDGSVFSERAASKIRGREQGWRYALDQLIAAGATPPPDLADDLALWLPIALRQVTRPLRHSGNHKYAWTLQKRDRRHLPASLPYPKILVPQLSLAGVA